MASKRVLAKETKAEVERTLSKAAQRIERNANELLANPNDPEALHQYRISLRVARSLVTFVKPFCKEERVKILLRKLKTLQAPTSRVRELDMVVEDLQKGTREIMICTGALEEERAALLFDMQRKRARKAIKGVVAQLKNMPWRSSVKKDGISPKLLESRVKKMRKVCAVKMGATVYESHESVHSVRKQIKALRYVTREFAGVLSDDAGMVSAHAKAIQDQLGELCDCRNSARLVAELCGEQSVGTVFLFMRRADAIVEALNAQR